MATPSQPRPAEEQIVESSAFEAELFWHKHGRTIIIAAGLVLVCIIVVLLWLNNQRSQRLAAQALFAQAKDAAAWQKVITDYPKTESAANASLLLAAAQREAGDVDASSATYQSFLDSHPTHLLAGSAVLGLTENLLIKGQTAEALSKLRQLQSGGSASYVASFAAFAEGRVLMLQGKMVEAKKVLMGVIQVYPNTPPASLSGELVQEIDLLLPPAAAATATPAASPAQ